MQTKVSGFHPPPPNPLLTQVSATLPRGLSRLSQVRFTSFLSDEGPEALGRACQCCSAALRG